MLVFTGSTLAVAGCVGVVDGGDVGGSGFFTVHGKPLGRHVDNSVEDELIWYAFSSKGTQLIAGLTFGTSSISGVHKDAVGYLVSTSDCRVVNHGRISSRSNNLNILTSSLINLVLLTTKRPLLFKRVVRISPGNIPHINLLHIVPISRLTLGTDPSSLVNSLAVGRHISTHSSGGDRVVILSSFLTT